MYFLPGPPCAIVQNRKFGGPNGELGTAVRYLSQRYTMPTGRGKGVLTDIGAEELAHWEMIATMIFKLTQGATIAQIEAVGYGGHYAISSAMGDPVTDLHEDISATGCMTALKLVTLMIFTAIIYLPLIESGLLHPKPLTAPDQIQVGE